MCVCLILSWSNITSEGSNLTPAHHYPDFRFKTYAPLAFRYFRDLFGIKPDDYLVRLKPGRPCRSLFVFMLIIQTSAQSGSPPHLYGAMPQEANLVHSHFSAQQLKLTCWSYSRGLKKGHFKFLLSRLKGKKGDLRKYAESLPVTDCLPSISLHITRINSHCCL